jgi:16S rRNA (cytosine967-C5)-methyltransferase
VELANGTDVSSILDVDKEVVIQDMTAQRTGLFMEKAIKEIPPNPLVWDACAASGGKSILFHDILQKKHRLIVSDVRPSILENLKKRFAAAGIEYHQLFKADLERSTPNIPPVDLLLADVPCSGSGTWGRTPEWLQFFSESQLNQYSQLQRNILNHALPMVKQGGQLLYMTCSVYAAENEEQVAFIEQRGFRLRASALFEGWQNQADSLFAAWLTKESI